MQIRVPLSQDLMDNLGICMDNANVPFENIQHVLCMIANRANVRDDAIDHFLKLILKGDYAGAKKLAKSELGFLFEDEAVNLAPVEGPLFLANDPVFELLIKDYTQRMNDAPSYAEKINMMLVIVEMELHANRDGLIDIANKLAVLPSDVEAAYLKGQATILEAESVRLTRNVEHLKKSIEMLVAAGHKIPRDGEEDARECYDIAYWDHHYDVHP